MSRHIKRNRAGKEATAPCDQCSPCVRALHADQETNRRARETPSETSQSGTVPCVYMYVVVRLITLASNDQFSRNYFLTSLHKRLPDHRIFQFPGTSNTNISEERNLEDGQQ